MFTRFSRPVVLPLLLASATALGSSVAFAQSASTPSSSRLAPIQSVNDATITFGAGSDADLVLGQTLPVFRAGSVVAVVRITSLEARTSTATVIFSQEGAALSTSDSVTLVSPAATSVPGTPSSSGAESGGAPGSSGNAAGSAVGNAEGVRVPFETGASNESVPKAERAYNLLASLAAQGLIRSQPARFFQDEGARRHRYAEDIVLSRAQIAGFVAEALRNASSGKATGFERASLALLTRDFRRDLEQLGVESATLDAFSGRGAAVGISAFVRANLLGGDTGSKAILPFDERYGAGRTRSGLDARFNLFSSLSPELDFYGTIDTGTSLNAANLGANSVAGAPISQFAGSGSKTQIRNAYFTFNANRFVRGLTLSAGRREYYWGVGTFGTGLLSDAAGGYDSFSSRFERGSYRFEGLYSYLGRGPSGERRSLYGHNLSVQVGKQARIGLAETSLKVNSALSARDLLGAFTPLSLYFIDRPRFDNANTSNNAVVTAYGETAVARGVRTYGEIVIDDIATSSGNKIENRDGSTFGVQLFNPRNPAKAGLTGEYTRTNSLFYLEYGTLRPDYRYYERNTPIGFPIVPQLVNGLRPNQGGAESLRFEGYYQPLRKLTLFGSMQFADINSSDAGAGAVGAQGLSRQQIYRVGASYDLARNFSLTARAGRVQANQPNFINGQPQQNRSIYSLEAGYSF